jgi:hypothetical protein
MKQFNREYLATLPSKNKIRLRELALEYHQKCEEYDRLVCTGPIKNGSIAPIGAEVGLICRNARKVLREISEKMAKEGVCGDLWGEIQLVGYLIHYRGKL